MQESEPLGLLLARISRHQRQAVALAARRFDLTNQQFWVLVRIVEHAPLTVGKLAEHLHVDQTTASRVVWGLVERNFVENRTDPKDRRRVQLVLTPGGERLSRKLMPVAAEFRAAIERGLTPREVVVMRKLLNKILASLQEEAPKKRKSHALS